jgi:hypothetical protein
MIRLRPGARILDWQRRAIELRVLGLRYREIADSLRRSERTVEGVFQRSDVQAELDRLRALVEQTFLRVAQDSLAGILHDSTYPSLVTSERLGRHGSNGFLRRDDQPNCFGNNGEDGNTSVVASVGT